MFGIKQKIKKVLFAISSYFFIKEIAENKKENDIYEDLQEIVQNGDYYLHRNIYKNHKYIYFTRAVRSCSNWYNRNIYTFTWPRSYGCNVRLSFISI